jgi:DNA-binding MarR family transcriptional regulator
MSLNGNELTSTKQQPQAGIESLLSEVKALAIQQRKSAVVMHRPDGLPARGWEVMRALAAQGARTVPQIGRQILTSRQNVQMMVNRLRTEGWVEMGENASHKRSGLVSLTETGRRLVATAKQREEQFWANLCPESTAAQVEEAVSLLRGLRLALKEEGGLPAVTAATVHKQPKTRGGGPAKSVVPPEEDPPEGELPVSLL